MENEYIQQESKPMIHGSSLFGSVVIQQKKARSQGQRQEFINKICFDLGIEKHYWRGVFFQTLGVFKDSELEKLKEEALRFKANPGALFRKKLKSERERIKKELELEQIKATLK